MPDILWTSEELLSKAETLYEFVDLFTLYKVTERDYGNNTTLSMVEVHIIVAIDQNPGITLTELARIARRSKSFISQVIKKAEMANYITRTQQEDDNKKKRLLLTPAGKKLAAEHRAFDERALTKTYNYLLRDCTPEEIESFYKVMRTYNNIMTALAQKHGRL